MRKVSEEGEGRAKGAFRFDVQRVFCSSCVWFSLVSLSLSLSRSLPYLQSPSLAAAALYQILPLEA